VLSFSLSLFLGLIREAGRAVTRACCREVAGLFSPTRTLNAPTDLSDDLTDLWALIWRADKILGPLIAAVANVCGGYMCVGYAGVGACNCSYVRISFATIK
jgi:hypothetical protein